MLPALTVALLLSLTLLSRVSTRLKDADSGEAFLRSHGVESLGSVIYYKRSENASHCLDTETARSRLLQLCDARAVLEQCVDTEEAIRLVDCQGLTCRGQFSTNHTQCLLEKSGLTALPKDDNGNFALCPPPDNLTRFFEWLEPPWALSVWSGGFFDCITALPPKSKIARRLHCIEGQPILQHRILFRSPDFLKSDEREVKCIWTQSCHGPQMFVSQLACYDIDQNKKPVEDSQDREFESPIGAQSIADLNDASESGMDDALDLRSGNDEGSASWISVSSFVLLMFSVMIAWT